MLNFNEVYNTGIGMGNTPSIELDNSAAQKIVNFLFVVVVFFVTRQVPFSVLSPVMNAAVVLMLSFSLWNRKPDKYSLYLILVFLLMPLTFNLIYSIIFTDNKITLALKFYITLLSVGLAYFVSVGKRSLRAFIILCLIQVFVMLIIYLYIIVFLDIRSYLPIRAFVLDKGWGDIYTYNGIFYRIQLKGSALLVVAFILNFEIQLFKRNLFVGLLLFIGIILAGNFAYSVSTSIYIIYKLFNLDNVKSLNVHALKLIFFTLLIISISPIVYDYIKSVLEMKSDGSLSTRSDQFTWLTKSLFENGFTSLLGQGLGNTLDVTSSYRDYTGDTYFELQAIYILNQLGIIFFSLFLIYNVLIILKKWGKGNFIIYFAYLVYISYAITNPYILDTNQVVVIIVLNGWLVIKKSNEYNKSSGSSCALQA